MCWLLPDDGKVVIACAPVGLFRSDSVDPELVSVKEEIPRDEGLPIGFQLTYAFNRHVDACKGITSAKAEI